jgi:hypothetical protein
VKLELGHKFDLCFGKFECYREQLDNQPWDSQLTLKKYFPDQERKPLAADRGGGAVNPEHRGWALLLLILGSGPLQI